MDLPKKLGCTDIRRADLWGTAWGLQLHLSEKWLNVEPESDSKAVVALSSNSSNSKLLYCNVINVCGVWLSCLHSFRIEHVPRELKRPSKRIG